MDGDCYHVLIDIYVASNIQTNTLLFPVNKDDFSMMSQWTLPLFLLIPLQEYFELEWILLLLTLFIVLFCDCNFKR